MSLEFKCLHEKLMRLLEVSENGTLCSLAAHAGGSAVSYRIYNQGRWMKAQRSFSGGARTREFLFGASYR